MIMWLQIFEKVLPDVNDSPSTAVVKAEFGRPYAKKG